MQQGRVRRRRTGTSRRDLPAPHPLEARDVIGRAEVRRTTAASPSRSAGARSRSARGATTSTAFCARTRPTACPTSRSPTPRSARLGNRPRRRRGRARVPRRLGPPHHAARRPAAARGRSRRPRHGHPAEDRVAGASRRFPISRARRSGRAAKEARLARSEGARSRSRRHADRPPADTEIAELDAKIPTLTDAPSCDRRFQEWDDPRRGPRSATNARTTAPPPTGPLYRPADGRLSPLENQLYRVEVHRGCDTGAPTFKWSRDNGTVVTAIRKISGKEIAVDDLGPDDVLGFATGQWVELSDDPSSSKASRASSRRSTG